MRSRRMSKVKFDSKMILDVIAASLLVQEAPKLINQVVQLDETLQTVAGVGAGYLAGTFFKRPNLANASIGLGVVQFIAPMVSNLLGGGSPITIPNSSSQVPSIPTSAGSPMIDVSSGEALSKYFSLNEYVSNPTKQMNYDDYRSSYGQ